MAKSHERVLVLDFGAQYGQLIARRVRDLGVYSELLPGDTPFAEIEGLHPRAIILSGGPSSVYDPESPRPDPALYDSGLPILGICYGMQLLAHHLGGEVVAAQAREYGRTAVEVLRPEPLFAGLERELATWMSHSDRVEGAPPGFEVLARSAQAPVAAMGSSERAIYGLQFHPEVAHTPSGSDILRHFLFDVAGCSGDWNMASFVDEAVERIRRQVGEGRTLVALSGGVDSAVAAALVHRAIGDRLTAVFVDHGLLRQGEAEEVRETFTGAFPLSLRYVDASERFLSQLAAVTDPEEKRKRIGTAFIRVFEEEARSLGQVDFLVQGTLYPDVIESGGGKAQTIKSHHNVGGLPPDLQFALVEPLRLLFKDEVRRLGLELGLPESIVYRQPFPGPGLAVRIIGEVTEERLAIVRAADAIVREEIRAAGLEREIWQAFAVLPAISSVGVMGDGRTYAHPIIVRAVTSQDGMTADWARLPHDLLDRLASRIIGEVPGVNRLVYDVTSKPPGTIEWE